jgi:hypothetical protein
MTESVEPVRAWARQLAAVDPADRIAAAQALLHAVESARPAAAALARATGDADCELAALASEALENLGPPDVSDLPELIRILTDEKSDCAYWGATLIGRLGAESAPAVDALAHAVESRSELSVRERAVWALGQIGPAAVSARRVLEAAANSSTPRLARLARAALEAI